MPRPKGSKNKLGRTLARIIEERGYLAPSAFLLDVLTDDNAPLPARIDAAKALLPYELRKLPQAVEVEGTIHVDPIGQLIESVRAGRIIEHDGSSDQPGAVRQIQ